MIQKKNPKKQTYLKADRILMTEIVKGKLQLTHRTDRFSVLNKSIKSTLLWT